uniref:Uncharacterized protein n=1 Tax=Arundo donax TaxID=35708 RepID=A0A0A9HJW8_ARUDO
MTCFGKLSAMLLCKKEFVQLSGDCIMPDAFVRTRECQGIKEHSTG